ncbi:MAG: hypothetical protein PHQ05_00310 [Sterolibacterium sp.]|nr:hypothetical protein [Sterolibacterium sp.]
MSAADPAELSAHCSPNSVLPDQIMYGAGMSPMGRSVQLLKRVKIEEELTLVSGILRRGRIAQMISGGLRIEVRCRRRPATVVYLGTRLRNSRPPAFAHTSVRPWQCTVGRLLERGWMIYQKGEINENQG